MSQYRQNAGCVIRQGVTHRMKCDQSGNHYDILAIDDQGDFHALIHATNADLENFDGTIVNAFTFGPALIVDGQMTENYEDNDYGAFKKAQRMGIGQVGPLEYICLCCEGPEDPPDKNGLTLEQFAELAASFGDVQVFYNLDGGSSSTLVFRGKDRKGKEQLYTKINARRNGKVRPVGGAIYFTSAWLADEEQP